MPQFDIVENSKPLELFRMKYVKMDIVGAWKVLFSVILRAYHLRAYRIEESSIIDTGAVIMNDEEEVGIYAGNLDKYIMMKMQNKSTGSFILNVSPRHFAA